MEPVQPSRREVVARALSCATIAVVLVGHERGRIVPETKLDVLLDPFGMLGRALVAWDATAGFGRLQNQAVGYVAPMGAWSALCETVGLSPWLAQRLWLAGVVSLSLWGAHRVACAVGVRGAGPRLVAAWAYALAPATVSITFFQSAGQLPYALVPHVLAALLAPRPGSSPRQTAARSTLWIAAMGGVNGASAIAVLPLVAVWFATRSRGPERRRLLGWWCGGAVAATLWWAVPLLVSIRYGIRFTDYTESSSVTTITESATEVLRGTGNWLSYLETSAGPWLPGGWALASSRVAIVATALLAAAGLAGLARRDAPERLWLVSSLLLGATAMGIGYAGAAGGPFAATTQELLDGPLAPLRNVHKLSAVVRLPLAIGIGHLVAVLAGALRRAPRPSGARRAPLPQLAAVAAALVVVVATVPALDRGLTAPGSFDDVSASWRQAAAWLDDEVPEGGRALVLPGSSFGEYRWGRPLDEPLASLDPPSWAVRDLVPLGGNGSTRLLDGLDAALQADALPDGFVPSLQRAGITHLVVRNDLDLDRTGGPRPATVRRLLQGATDEGVELVASFGPVRTAEAGDRRRSPRPGVGPGGEAAEAFRDLDVYAVAGVVAPVATYPAAGALVATGGPEALLGMEASLVADRAVVLAVDDPGDLPDPIAVQTDTARRRDVEFGSVRDGSTATLTATERSPASGEEPFDRYVGDGRGATDDLTVAELEGAATLGDSRTPDGFLTPEGQPFAALDGNADTAWVPQRGEVGEWLEVAFDEPVAVGSVLVESTRADGRRITEVQVRTDGGTAGGELGDGGSVEVALDAGATRRVRIEVAAIGGEPDLGTLGLRTIELRDPSGTPLPIARPLVAAGTGAGAPEVVLLARDHRDRLDDVRRDEDGRFERIIGWAGGDATLDGRSVLGDGALADELLEQVTSAGPTDLVASSSSRYRDHVATAARWAFDGDPATAWVSDIEVGAPVLDVRWEGAVLVDSLVLDVLETGLDQVAAVEVTLAGRTERHDVDASGRIALDQPANVDRLSLAFPGARATSARRVGVAEVEIPALFGRRAAVPDRAAEVRLACGAGPELRVDGTPIDTEVEASVADLLEGRGARWRACGPLALTAGEHRVEARRGALFPTAIRLLPTAGLPEPPPSRSLRVTRWDAEHPAVAVGAGPATIVATTENANEGWTATLASDDPALDGTELRAVTVDGWRQGWIVPEGAAGTVEATFGPGRLHRGGLVVGGLALLALLAAALIPPRRRADRPGRVAVALAPRPVGRRTRLAVGLGGVAVAVALSPLALVVGIALVGATTAAARSTRAGGRAGRTPSETSLPAWVAPACALGAGAVALGGAGVGIYGTTGTFSHAAQVLATASLLAVAASVAVDPSLADDVGRAREREGGGDQAGGAA